MAYSDQFKPAGNMNEAAFRQKISDMRNDYSPVIEINAVVENNADNLHKQGLGALRALANNKDKSFLQRETEYLMRLADKALGKRVNEKLLKESEQELQARYEEFNMGLAKAVREYSDYKEAEVADKPVKVKNPNRILYAELLYQRLSESRVDDILSTGAETYTLLLRQIVERAAKESGIDTGRQGGTARS